MTEMTTDRLTAYSDGVIAIASTLLVLNVHPPGVGEPLTWSTLWAQWPAYAGYVISFVIIGIMWVAHHRMVALLARVDETLLYLNLALLGLIAFIPFPTAVLADALAQPRSSEIVIAEVLYGGTMAAIGGVFTLLWFHLARRPRLLRASEHHQTARRRARLALLGPLAFLLTIPLAYLNTRLPLVSYALIGGLFASRPPRS
jgi:uncharacterized membrane protein